MQAREEEKGQDNCSPGPVENDLAGCDLTLDLLRYLPWKISLRKLVPIRFASSSSRLYPVTAAAATDQFAPGHDSLPSEEIYYDITVCFFGVPPVFSYILK